MIAVGIFGDIVRLSRWRRDYESGIASISEFRGIRSRVLRVEALLSKVDKKLLVRFIAGGKALHIVFCDRIPVGANLEVHP